MSLRLPGLRTLPAPGDTPVARGQNGLVNLWNFQPGAWERCLITGARFTANASSSIASETGLYQQCHTGPTQNAISCALPQQMGGAMSGLFLYRITAQNGWGVSWYVNHGYWSGIFNYQDSGIYYASAAGDLSGEILGAVQGPARPLSPWRCVVWSSNTNRFRLSVSGGPIAMDSTCAGLTIANYSLLIGGSGDPNHRSDTYIRMGALWRRELSDAELTSLSANPWQLFAPAPRRFWLGAAGGATTITATVGAAAATGVGALLNTTTQTGVGAASATGVGAQISATLQCGPGAATATGVAAQINTTVQTTVGAASAIGVGALITTGGATTIATSVAESAASGVPALLNTTLQCLVGASSAAGVTARVNRSISATVGGAAATGVAAVIAGNSTIVAAVGAAIASGISAVVSSLTGSPIAPTAQPATFSQWRREPRVPNPSTTKAARDWFTVASQVPWVKIE